MKSITNRNQTEKKVILFYARQAQAELYARMAKEMEASHIAFIVQKEDEAKTVRKYSGESTPCIYNLTDFIEANWHSSRLEALSLHEIESVCGIPSIWKLFYTDRFLVNYPKEEDAVKFIKLHYLFIVDIVEKENPDFFVNEEVAIFSAYLFYYVCKARGCRYIGYSVPRNLSYEKILFTDEPFTHYPDLEYFYQNRGELAPSDYTDAEEMLQAIRQRHEKPAYMAKTGRKPSLWRNFLRPIAVFVKNDMFARRNFYDYETFHASIKPRLTYFRYHRQARYYQQPVGNEKFILFPLHYQPEASTLVKATDFADQADTVRMLAKNMPGGYTLYVKEHYAELGHRDTRFYKEMRKLPNVRVVDPWVDSHELIQKAEAVVVLTSTVGWEALMYGKPVVALGHVFYDTYRYCYKVRDIFNFAEELREILARFPSREEASKEFVPYFAAYLKAMYPGNYVLSDSRLTEVENVKNLTKALEEKICCNE